MRRKITLHGPSSLTVSLPSAWAKENDLKKGDEIDIQEGDNGLFIRPVNNNCTLLKTEVDFAGLDIETRKELILSLHKKGYDEIKINYDKETIGKEIYAYLSEMHLGFEIINQNGTYVIIRNISNPENEQFDNLFRRIFLITKEYSKKVEEILNDKNNFTSSCLVHESSMNRIANFCKRIALKDNKKDASFVLAIIFSLEKIARSMTQLLEEIQELDGDVDKNLIKLYVESCDLFDLVYKLFYKFSYEEYNSIKKKSNLTSKKIRDYKLSNLENICCVEQIENIKTETINILRQTLGLQV